MRIVIIIPTYNERRNIVALVDALHTECAGLPDRIAVLVVDDHSPDGTGDVVRALQQTHPDVHLLQGRRVGLGDAYVRGIRHAMDVLDADVVVQMDADFSHQPKDVPRLIAALASGAEIAIGSRYVKGGRVPYQWGITRRMNSFFGNLLARQLLDLHAVRDCTAGFRAIRVPVMRRIRLDELRVKGFAVLVAMLYEARALGANIREVPVTYIERTHGSSKLGISDIVEFVFNALRLRLRRARPVTQ